ncbi:MAG: TRAP transporter small permease [Acetobacteraceae bacterium]
MTGGEPGSALTRPLEGASRLGALASGWALLGLSVLTGVEVIGRRFLGFSMQGVDEIGGYVLAVTASFGFSWALFRRGHTRVDLLLQGCGPRLQAALNLGAAVAIAIAATFLAWHAAGVVAETVEFGSRASTPLRTPLIWPQAVWLAALLLFALSAIALALRAAQAAARHGAAAANAQIGPRALREEVKEELAAAGLEHASRGGGR